MSDAAHHAGPAIVWLRQDLRLDDQPALRAAAAHTAVVPVYVWSPGEEGGWEPGGASRWWLHHSLASLQAALRASGSELILCAGPSLAWLRAAARATGATAVYWCRRYEPAAAARDAAVAAELEGDGLVVRTFNGALLAEPTEVLKQDGTPYKVYTPYWNAACARYAQGPGIAPRPAPERLPPLPAGARALGSVPLAALGLLPAVDWAAGLRRTWTPGEAGAQRALAAFTGGAQARYAEARDLPAEPGTSRLSPHLHFGEISARRVFAAIGPKGSLAFRKELVWREFAHHLLHHFPHQVDRPLRREFEAFPWREDADALDAWRRGRTGYPIVDAGLRELWRTGFMHNRVRMVAASFLVKHLLIPWQQGARWFWDTLVDADLASNTLGWQWTAGCGADAAPYFRVFNPVLQGERFDPEGTYVRRWVPELARLPARWIHRPWEAPPAALAQAGVRLGPTYPRPVVEHAAARERALIAYERCKRDGPGG